VVSGKPAVTPAAAPNPAALKQRVKDAEKRVEALETSVQKALTLAKAKLEKGDEKAAAEAQEQLQKQVTACTEAQKLLTQDLTEARKGGPSAQSSVTELSKLSPRIRTVQASVNAELNKAKQASNAKKTAAEQQKAEARDEKLFKEALSAVQEMLTDAKEAVDSIVEFASPLVADAPDVVDEGLKASLREVEGHAQEAGTKINEARTKIGQSLQAAKQYAPKAGKAATEELNKLQTQVNELQQKITPYKSFQKEFRNKVNARKALSEIAEKLADAELEAEKASMMCSRASKALMSEDELKAADDAVRPASKCVVAVTQLIEQKIKTAGADRAMKDELVSMKNRATESRKTLDGITSSLKQQKDSLHMQETISQATAKVDKVDLALVKCQEAEMPFLKGIEILPDDESMGAIKDCEKAASETQAAVGQAQVFLRNKQADIKKMQGDVGKSIQEEFKQLTERVEAASKKLAQFRKETTDRKLGALIADVLVATAAAESKVKAMTTAAAPLMGDDIEAKSAKVLQEAKEKAAAAETGATAALAEARKVLNAKQSQARQGEAATALAKHSSKLSATDQELQKAKKAALMADKLIKAKKVLEEEGDRVKQAAEKVDKAEKLAKPAGGGKPSDKSIETIEALSTEAQKEFREATKNVQVHLGGASPKTKVALQALVDKVKKSTERLDKIKAITKEQRDRVVAQAAVKEAKKRADEIEAIMTKAGDAEAVFLKGADPAVDEAVEALEACMKFSEEMQKAINDARMWLATKNLELKGFKVEVKASLEALAAVNDRVNAVSSKLASFKKDMDGRKGSVRIQQAEQKVA
jgi:chromosome segregation ATPase